MIDRTPEPGKEGRVKIIPEDGSPAYYAVMEMADNPSEAGTPLNKATLLTDETANALGLTTPESALVTNALKRQTKALAAYGTTTGTSTAYVLAQPGFTLFDGAVIRFKLHVDSGATPTLDVNGTGAKALMLDENKPVSRSIPVGMWVTATYNAAFDFFVLQGSKNTGTFDYRGTLAHSAIFESLMGYSLAYVNRSVGR